MKLNNEHKGGCSAEGHLGGSANGLVDLSTEVHTYPIMFQIPLNLDLQN